MADEALGRGQADPATLLDSVPFAKSRGIALTRADAHEVVAALTWSPTLCTVAGVLHGGAVMALADTAGAVCAFLNLPPGAGTTTIESKTNFFRAVTGGQVRATARPLHVGRRTIAVRTELVDDRGRITAHVVQTQAVLTPPAASAPEPAPPG
jgi:uncharacterized protein (TIGR00369 family)